MTVWLTSITGLILLVVFTGTRKSLTGKQKLGLIVLEIGLVLFFAYRLLYH